MFLKNRRYLKGFIKGRRGERGVTAVEFALVAPVFLMFMLGIIDLGRLFWVKNLMQYAVEQTTRFAMVNPSATQNALEAYADGQVSGLFTGITFTADAPGTDVDVTTGVYYRTVSASYSFNYLIPLVTLSDIPLSASSRTPVNETP